MSASSKKKLRKEQNAAELTEKQLKEQKESKKLKVQTIAFVAVIALVLVIGLGSLAVTAFNNSGITEKTTAALTVGEHELSTAELNYFFMDNVNSFYSSWYENYGSYTDMYLQWMAGLDVTKPLNEQTYDAESGTNYGDYFAELAADSAVSAYTFYDLAIEEGYALSEAETAAIELAVSNIEDNAATAGYSSTESYLKAMYGNGAALKTFKQYLEIISISNRYLQDNYNNFTYDAAALDAYSAEHFDDYSSFSYCSFVVDPDDFLICTAEEGDEDHEHTEEEISKSVAVAKSVAEVLVASKATDAASLNEAINMLPDAPYAEDEYAVCSETNDLLFSNITNEKYAAWLADASRTPGEMTIIPNETTSTDEDGNETTTVNNYTVLMFLERNDNNMQLVNVRHILKSFTGGTTDDYGNTTYSDEEKKAAEDFITTLQDTWTASGATEESFSDLATINSTDTGSASNGGLYEDVYPTQMVDTFNDWCFDESRQPGDYGIVESEFGYHLMYFVGHSDTTYRNFMIENVLRSEDYEAWYNEIFEAAEHTVIDTSKLSIDMVISNS